MGKIVRIQISAGGFLLPALALMMLPIQWVFAMMTAAAVHEFCHIAMIYMLNGSVYSISIGARGAQIETDSMHPGKELLCAMAGPLGSAALIFLARHFPRLAICGAVHCLYNCLPLFPFDGGRILRSIIDLLFSPARSERIWRYAQIGLRVLFAGAVIYIGIKLGGTILAFAVILLIGLWRKTSCQQPVLAIQ